jgi:Flp pilus assembly pilin Flp
MPSTNASRQKEVRFSMSLSKTRAQIQTAIRREDGQTMAEYGVTLTVITVATVAVFTALSGGITGAINSVIDLLPG